MNWDALLNAARRRKSKGAPEDSRSEFQRDFDRSLFSAGVRRLQDKAQVFPLEPNDSVRTRLTHSHEVSAVARGIADQVCIALRKNRVITDDQTRIIPIIAATCGLLHDLGNPPFGHVGESAIRAWMNDGPRDILKPLRDAKGQPTQLSNDFSKFEGNAQTMRIVCRLQLLLDDNGLNLTQGTLSALRKYIAPSHQCDKKIAGRKKVGYFFSEQDRIDEIEAATGTAGCRNPIATLVEAADDAVYLSVDLEDAITKGVVRWADLVRHLSSHSYPVLAELIGRTEDSLKDCAHNDALSAHQKDCVLSQLFRTHFIGHCVKAATEAFIANYDDVMSGKFTRSLIDTDAGAIGILRDFERDNVYTHSNVLRLESGGIQVVSDLLDFFWTAFLANDDSPRARRAKGLLSENQKLVYDKAIAVAGQDKSLQRYAQLQLLCDYVSGMTDTFATTLRNDLYGYH